MKRPASNLTPTSPFQKLSAVAAACALATVAAASALSPREVAATPSEQQRRTPVVQAVEQAGPAVVNIYTETLVQESSPFRSRGPRDPFFDNFFRDFFGGPARPSQRRRHSLGSGVIVDRSGIIVTNEHVILRADIIRVQLADQREFEAKLVGSDSDADLAVLRVEAPVELPFVAIGDDDSVMIGETVIAIGNPFGLSHSVTTGVVSAVGRSFMNGDIAYQDFLQTDASINPGNSGGPLLDVTGRLLAINTAVHQGGQGIGFAIPIWRVRNIVDQLLEHGSVVPAWTGLRVQSLDPELANHFGVRPDAGVLVREVESRSPAAAASLARGDIITHVQEHRVSGLRDYSARMAGLSPGGKLRLRLWNGGKTRDAVLNIVSLPSERVDQFAWEALGLSIEDAPDASAVRVREVDPKGPTAQIGVRPGDFVAGIGGVETPTADSFRAELARQRGRNNVLLAVVRDRKLYRVTVPLAATR